MNRISADDLYPVLNEVTDYPVTSDELAAKAQDVGASIEVTYFFESIPANTQFDDESEILSMAEQIDPNETTGESAGTETTLLDENDEIL